MNKRIYLYSFLFGLGTGLFFIFTSALVSSIGDITTAIFQFMARTIPIPEDGLGWDSISLLLISIPFLIIFMLSPWFRKKVKARTQKVSFLFFSFLSFSLGVFLSYGVWILIVLIAFSRI